VETAQLRRCPRSNQSDNAGNILVSDTNNGRNKILANRRVAFRHGKAGKGPGELQGPWWNCDRFQRPYLETNGKFISNGRRKNGDSRGWYFQIWLLIPKPDAYASSIATNKVPLFDPSGNKVRSRKPNPTDKLEGALLLALLKNSLYVVAFCEPDRTGKEGRQPHATLIDETMAKHSEAEAVAAQDGI
jgi:hypothetical protein